MPEIDILPARVRATGRQCDSIATTWLELAHQRLAGGEENLGAARMGTMDSAASAAECVSSWYQTFRSAQNTMGALGDKLVATANSVDRTDTSAAELFDGIAPYIPEITITE